MDCTCALARPKTFRVGSPATTSRKWCPSRLSVSHCRRVRASVALPTSTMNTGIRGRVSTIVTVATQSSVTMRASTATGTTTASTSCGRYLAKYPSRASTPRVASVVSSPVRCPDSQPGPSRTACSTTWPRSADLTSADARCAAASCTQTSPARAATTAARPMRVPRRSARSAPSRKAALMAKARRPAWAMMSKAWAIPTAAVPAMYTTLARAYRRSRGSRGVIVAHCACWPRRSGASTERRSGRAQPTRWLSASSNARRFSSAASASAGSGMSSTVSRRRNTQ